MENMINKQVEAFQVSAFCKGEFLDVTQEDLKGHWSVLFFIRQILPLSALQSWEIWQIIMRNSKKKGVRYIPYRKILILYTRHGRMRQTLLKRFSM